MLLPACATQAEHDFIRDGDEPAVDPAWFPAEEKVAASSLAIPPQRDVTEPSSQTSKERTEILPFSVQDKE